LCAPPPPPHSSSPKNTSWPPSLADKQGTGLIILALAILSQRMPPPSSRRNQNTQRCACRACAPLKSQALRQWTTQQGNRQLADCVSTWRLRTGNSYPFQRERLTSGWLARRGPEIARQQVAGSIAQLRLSARDRHLWGVLYRRPKEQESFGKTCADQVQRRNRKVGRFLAGPKDRRT